MQWGMGGRVTPTILRSDIYPVERFSTPSTMATARDGALCDGRGEWQLVGGGGGAVQWGWRSVDIAITSKKWASTPSDVTDNGPGGGNKSRRE